MSQHFNLFTPPSGSNKKACIVKKMFYCVVCSAPATRKCEVCKDAHYCSALHQKDDREAHNNGQVGKVLSCGQSQACNLKVEALVATQVAKATVAMNLELERARGEGVEREAAAEKAKLGLIAQVAAAGVEREAALKREVALESLRRKMGEKLEEAENKLKDGAVATLALGAWEVQREAERKALEDLFQCSSCSSVLVDPVSLPCGHNHCLTCITTWVAATPVSTTCPVCRGAFVPPLQWCVNTGIADALAANNGPGFKEQANTLLFHSQLRGDTPGPALATLGSTAAGAKGGVDLAKELRLAGGTFTPPLYYALEKETDDWKKLAFEMIKRGGCDLNSGAGALDYCWDFPTAQLLLTKGATKCSSMAVKTFCDYNRFCWTSDYTEADDLLLAFLSFLPQPLRKEDDNLQVCLFNSLQLGHKKTALKLLQADIPFKESLFAAAKPM
jgi:hypothetical protein